MTTRQQKRRLKNLVGLALLPVVCWGGFRWLETRLIYHPVRSDGAYPALSGGGWEKVTLRTPDGLALDARFHPPATPEQPVVLVCHGNAGHLGHRGELADALLELGLGVLLFDYRGYGASEGRPSEDGLALDAETAWQWLIDRGVAPTNLLAMGVSLGGGVAVELATRRPLGGLILVSTFTSIPDVAADLHPWLPGRRLVRTRFDNRAKLPRLELPLLILHSRQDTIIPFHHGRELFAAARPPRLFREIQGDHNDTFDLGRKSFQAAVREFLRWRTRPASEWPETDTTASTEP